MIHSQLPGPVRLFAPAKVNLGLEVLGRREDGYHEVVTVLETISLLDVIDLTPADRLSVWSSCGIDEEDNLVKLGVAGLAERIGIDLPVRVRIEKRIPAAAGLGGGSSDAGTVLAALRDVLRLDSSAVEEVAASLGSDVPFFLRGGAALATGTGTNLTPVAPVERRWYVVVVPDLEIHAKTAAMYGSLRDEDYSDGSRTRDVAKELESGHVSGWDRLINSFHRPVLEHEPCQAAAQALIEAGASLVLPTGAGPALYTVCDSFETASRVASRVRRGHLEVYLATSIGPGVNHARLLPLS